jgi:murein DD-endopeptidase MepM/ murein hydrolase activator NlpD
MKFSALSRVLLFIALLPGLLPTQVVSAQNEMPVYTVQVGDTLGGLSQVFHTPSTRLIQVNQISAPDNLIPGTQLFIPSLEGSTGDVSLLRLAPGDSMLTLARQYGVKSVDFYRLNFLTQPESLPLNAEVILLNAAEKEQTRVPLTAGMTGLELAASYGVNPWTAAEANDLKGPWDLVQNDTLFLPIAPDSNASGLMPGVSDLTVSLLPLKQGKTILFSAKVKEGTTLSGSLIGFPLDFLQGPDGLSTAYGGIARLTPPGIYPLFLTSKDANGQTFTLTENLQVQEVTSYGVDYPFQVADELVDPAITVPEMDQVNRVVAPITPQKYWSGSFRSPSPTPDCITSTFGRLRSYNGSDYIYFHSGIDFCGNETTPVYAAADGVVVFTGLLTVRGNATIIDHGQGVYTGYWHQSQILVNVGDRVTVGQQIGVVGATGRVTGPHLHFEVFVGGAQVDPTEWLAGLYP